MIFMIKILTSLSRRNKQALMLAFDAISVFCLIYVAFWIRLGSFFYPSGNGDLLIVICTSPLLAMLIFTGFGLYREVIRFVSFKALWYIIQAVSLYAALWGLIVFMANIEGVPRSVIIINWALVIFVIGGSRFFARWLLLGQVNRVNVVIYGAGSAGRQLSTALSQSKEYNPIAFIDDSSEIISRSIDGLKTFSPDDLQILIDKKGVQEVLIAIPTLNRSRRREVINFLESYPVVVRSLPGVSELAQGKVKVNDLLEIDLRDLLGRESQLNQIMIFLKRTF